MNRRTANCALALVMATIFCAADALAADTLRLIGRTDVPGYEGDFDHFGLDLAGNRLFLAGEDGGSLEVFDLRSGAHVRSVADYAETHSPSPGTEPLTWDNPWHVVGYIT